MRSLQARQCILSTSGKCIERSLILPPFSYLFTDASDSHLTRSLMLTSILRCPGSVAFSTHSKGIFT